jgi:hypothetical protein
VPASSRSRAANRQAAPAGLATLDAMAALSRQTGSVVHVVLAREPGTVEHARVVAEAAGVDVSIDLMAATIRVRYAGALDVTDVGG